MNEKDLTDEEKARIIAETYPLPEKPSAVPRSVLPYYILDENANAVPCGDLMEWAMWMQKHWDKRHFGDETHHGVRISTVFLGVDHDWSLTGSPKLFETMVFGGEYKGYMYRYSTAAEAIVGHRAICDAIFRGKMSQEIRKRLDGGL